MSATEGKKIYTEGNEQKGWGLVKDEKREKKK